MQQEYNSQVKICQNSTKSKYCIGDFEISPDDFAFYEKIKVPPPTFCPTCRMIRRFNFRNEGMLFRKKDLSTGQEIFSGFSSFSKVKIYENNYWFSDSWDKLKTGKDYNFSKPFFEQFRELLETAPIPARSVFNLVNSDYVNEASECKNVYLSFNLDYVEDSAYLRKIRGAKKSFDSYECQEIELCYECNVVNNSYKTFYSMECDSCVDVWFSRDLRGCTDCFGCIGLRNKSNYFFNKPYSKEEYKEKISEYLTGKYSDICRAQIAAVQFWLTFPHKYYIGNKNVNSSGDRLVNCKNVQDSYFIKSAEDIRYCQDIWTKTNSCYDYSVWGDGAQNVYECMTCGLGINNIRFCFNSWESCYDLEYCVYVLNSKNCFGCVGLHKNEYCILNKQYTKEEYEDLLPRIKQHMMDMPYVDTKGRVYKYGEFFPQEMSPNSYNESLANDFFPLSQEEIYENGYSFNEIIRGNYDITLQNDDIPDSINNTQDDILNEIINCKTCNRAYRVIEKELQFYRQMNIPIPRNCQDCRFTERFKLINKPIFLERGCMNKNCENVFKTNYPENSLDIVYCEKCYQQEII